MGVKQSRQKRQQQGQKIHSRKRLEGGRENVRQPGNQGRKDGGPYNLRFPPKSPNWGGSRATNRRAEGTPKNSRDGKEKREGCFFPSVQAEKREAGNTPHVKHRGNGFGIKKGKCPPTQRGKPSKWPDRAPMSQANFRTQQGKREIGAATKRGKMRPNGYTTRVEGKKNLF